MNAPIRIALVGVGGFGRTHLSCIDSPVVSELAVLSAVVARESDAERFAREEQEIRDRGVPVFRSLEDVFATLAGEIDLISLPVGIAAHAPLSVQTLRAGYHVFCEKPAAGTVADALRMRDAAADSGRQLIIGYQHVFSPSIQRIKKIALSGSLGRLIEARTIASWPRDRSYYGRNGWSGRIEAGGMRIYDSPLQNAVAHYLQNMLYVAGPAPNESARPVEVYGENYRAKDIESADTQYIRIRVENGAVLKFWVSHAVDETYGPFAEYVFEGGRIRWSHQKGYSEVFASEADRPAETFDNGDVEIHSYAYADALRSLMEGRIPLCTIGNSIQHTACIEALFESSSGVTPIDVEHVGSVPWGNDSTNTIVPGMSDLLRRLYDQGVGFAEAGIPWGKAGKPIIPKELV